MVTGIIKTVVGFGMSIGEEVSRTLQGVYEMESGFEKWTKLVISILKQRDYSLGNGYYKTCLSFLNEQKEIIYGTKVFFTFPKFFISKKFNQQTQTTEYGLTVPTKINGKTNKEKIKKTVDWGLFLYGIGDVFCSGKLLQKAGIYSFPWLSQVAANIGSHEISSNWKCKDIPVFNTLLDKPKDFCMVIASGIGIWDCLKPKKFNEKGAEVPSDRWNIENLIKLTGNIGKIILISGGQLMKKNRLDTALNWIDIMTCSASVVSDIIKKRNR